MILVSMLVSVQETIIERTGQHGCIGVVDVAFFPGATSA